MAAAGRKISAFAAALVLVLLAASARSAATERIVGDWRTGLALHGFDPVAYFVDAKAVQGRADLEFSHGGMTWRFRNEGNLTAFRRDPQVYSPLFGGYDPIGIGRGVSTPGHPELWHVFQGRLLLFYSAENRALFVDASERMLAVAQSKWPDVAARLLP